MRYKCLSDDENDLLNHVSMWGSEGYPIQHIGRGWTWRYRSISGPPVSFKTKKLAVEHFELYHSILLDRIAGRISS